MEQEISTRELYELKRDQRRESNRKKHGKEIINGASKKILWWIIAAITIAGIGYGMVILFRQTTKERPGEAILIQGQEHISVGAAHPEYNSNPPTSGWHYANEADWGMSENAIPDEQILHNLEHGGIWISYKNIDDSTKKQLEKISRSGSKIIITPRQGNDTPITLASWGRLQKLEQFDEIAIMNFIKANKNRSPEPFTS